MNSGVVRAIKERRVVTFLYEGFVRTVEPHVYGVHKDSGNELLSGYQIAGLSHSSQRPGWRLFRLTEVRAFTVTEKVFNHPRPGYNGRDARMGAIFARV